LQKTSFPALRYYEKLAIPFSLLDMYVSHVRDKIEVVQIAAILNTKKRVFSVTLRNGKALHATPTISDI
jgi:hypothetical protein